MNSDFINYVRNMKPMPMVGTEDLLKLLDMAEERNEAIELLRWYLHYDGDNGDGDFDDRIRPFLDRIDKHDDGKEEEHGV